MQHHVSSREGCGSRGAWQYSARHGAYRLSLHNDLAGARILVTGATGLIGSHLVPALLARSAVVHILKVPAPEPDSLLARSGDMERVTVHIGQLEDDAVVAETVERSRPDMVVHLGAQTLVGAAREDPTHTFRVNVAGTWTLLEACRRSDPPPRALAVASSDKAYGPSERLPYVETDSLAGTEPYEASKAMTDILAQTYATAYGLPTRIARCGNVYGSGDLNFSRIVPGTIRSLLRGERAVLRSDGTPVRDYIHVDDVVNGYLSLLRPSIRPGEAFNLSSGERMSVFEILDAVHEVAGGPPEPIFDRNDHGEIQEQYLDSTKAKKILGWTSTRRFRESLPSVIEWYSGLLLDLNGKVAKP